AYSSVWTKQIEYFSKKYEIEAPDLNLASSIKHKASTILIGWSYGGMLAVEMASEEPEKFKALVLVSCSAKFSDGVSIAVIKNIIRNLNKDFETTMRNCYRTFFYKEEAPSWNEFINPSPKQRDWVLPDKKITIEILNRLANLDLYNRLEFITIPTLIVHGDKDEVCPLEAGMLLHKNIKGSRLKVLKDTGHMPFYTRAEEFNRILEDFIDNVK
ncbi:MAG: alpha/beta hydrolase, partial [Candidatus Omnitrophica bacterium]|nr:alpha/beta hydrolase [Candidatus Omnitrophota bacterium]